MVLRFKWNSICAFSIPQGAFCIVYRDSTGQPSEGILKILGIWYLMPQLLKVTIVFLSCHVCHFFICKCFNSFCMESSPPFPRQILGLLASFGSGRTGWISAGGGNGWVGLSQDRLAVGCNEMLQLGCKKPQTGPPKRRFTPHWTVNSRWRASKFQLVQVLIFPCLIPCAGGRGSILYPMLPRGNRQRWCGKKIEGWKT